MKNSTRHHTTAGAIAAATLALLLLGGCTAAPVAGGGDDGGSEQPTTEAPPAAERPEGLDASLPVPPGVLVSATPESSAWEYIYGEVTSDEARAFADGFEAAGYDLKVTVDSGGVEQWYFQNADWAVKLEQTHDAEQLRYWVDPISE
jgi:hypothetical protein